MLTWTCGFKLKEIYETGRSENVGTGTAHFGYEEREINKIVLNVLKVRMTPAG